MSEYVSVINEALAEKDALAKARRLNRKGRKRLDRSGKNDHLSGLAPYGDTIGGKRRRPILFGQNGTEIVFRPGFNFDRLSPSDRVSFHQFAKNQKV